MAAYCVFRFLGQPTKSFRPNTKVPSRCLNRHADSLDNLILEGRFMPVFKAMVAGYTIGRFTSDGAMRPDRTNVKGITDNVFIRYRKKGITDNVFIRYLKS